MAEQKQTERVSKKKRMTRIMAWILSILMIGSGAALTITMILEAFVK